MYQYVGLLLKRYGGSRKKIQSRPISMSTKASPFPSLPPHERQAGLNLKRIRPAC